MLWRSAQGVEQAAVPGSTLAEVLDRDSNWERVEEQSAAPTSEMPDLNRLTRKEIDVIAEKAGVEKPGSLPNKAAVIDAIHEARG